LINSLKSVVAPTRQHTPY